ncbi:MAG: hypothetical protein KGK08_05035 [Acidobacteriota bacterium]|nr:hypothetical protein [Acidobacteriota bacterium]
MTWHSFLSFDTLESRHLLASYAVVFLIQFGFLARIVLGWLRSGAPRP